VMAMNAIEPLLPVEDPIDVVPVETTVLGL
jgi:hypothetical protein